MYPSSQVTLLAYYFDIL